MIDFQIKWFSDVVLIRSCFIGLFEGQVVWFDGVISRRWFSQLFTEWRFLYRMLSVFLNLLISNRDRILPAAASRHRLTIRNPIEFRIRRRHRVHQALRPSTAMELRLFKCHSMFLFPSNEFDVVNSLLQHINLLLDIFLSILSRNNKLLTFSNIAWVCL